MLSRIADVVNEHRRVLLPIEGYEKTRPMSLEEAVKPVISLFPADSLSIKVQVVKERCRHPADGLTQDESASIMLYTLDWLSVETSLYYILNEALRLEDRNNLRKWFPYLRLFISALVKLPPIDSVVYRGIKRNLASEYLEDHPCTWWGVSSSTTTINVLQSEDFCGRAGVRTIFHIRCRSGRNIKNHSYHQNESEAVLLPGRHFRVGSHYSAEDGLQMIQLEEITPPYELLKLPDISSWRRFTPGISLLGPCSNAECEAYQKEVIISLGFRKFDALIDTNSTTAKCPTCGHYVEVAGLAFCGCQWRVHGIKQTSRSHEPTHFSEDWSHAHGYSLFEYNLHEEVIYRQLIVEAKEENSS